MKINFGKKQKAFNSCGTEIVDRERHKHNIRVIMSCESGVSEEEESYSED